MIELTTAEVAEIRGCAERHVRRLISHGKLNANKRLNSNNRLTNYIPITALTAAEQKRYYAVHPAVNKATTEKKATKALDEFTESERVEIGFWTKTVNEWQDYRAVHSEKDKESVDNAFIAHFRFENPEVNISRSILYRKKKAKESNDLQGLVDCRGKSKKGKTAMHEYVASVFGGFYLKEVKEQNIAQCVLYTKLWVEEHRPELLPLPSYSSFLRLAESIPLAVKTLAIKGNKEFYDRCSLFINRDYSALEPNECWVADNHTLDIMVTDDFGNVKRLYLTAFMDMRTGIITGRYVSDAPSSQSTLMALRNGIERYGIPKIIYVDNGREFLTYDIGGRGHRAKKTYADGSVPFEPPGVFERLGIQMINAIVHNARAKTVERRFLDVKRQFSILFNTFTGGNVIEKPEVLKSELKKGNIPHERDVIEKINTMIDGFFNLQEYGGSVKADKGKRRIDVYYEHLTEVTKADKATLDLMLMRTGRPQKVTNRGVFVNIHGVKVNYFTIDFLTRYQGKQVYVRYDPQNLGTCRVYSMENAYICELPQDTTMTMRVFASQDEIAAAMKLEREHKKHVAQVASEYMFPEIERLTSLSLMTRNAEKQLEAQAELPQKSAKAIRLARVDEKPILQNAVGDLGELNIAKMNANFIKYNGGSENE